MNYNRLFVLTTLQLALVASGFAAQTRTFTQADLEKIVGQLDSAIPHNDKLLYPIKCSVVDSKKVNAYATAVKEGSGQRATMVVYTGFVNAAGGDIRLIRACVAHEMSHLSRGHVLSPTLAAEDIDNLWTRQQEYEADRFGAAALGKSGFSKVDMVDLMLMFDARRSREGDWLGRLTNDHADPKARAAAIADDPKALQARVLFDTGLAYEDARSHVYAKLLFDAAGQTWPALTESYINAAKSAMLFYYDSLPGGIRGDWFRPDFGPFIKQTAKSRADKITPEDLERYASALAAANKAIATNPNNDVAQETLALVQILEPDGKKDVVQKGVDRLKAQLGKETDPAAKLRAANNVAVGLDRLGDRQGAYAAMLDAQKGTNSFNAALGENLGRLTVKGRSKADDTLAAAVLFTWLGETPSVNPHWSEVKKNFDGLVASAGLPTKDIPRKPIYLASVVSLNTSGKELGVLLPFRVYTQLLGKADKRVIFNSDWPDFGETSWDGGKVKVWTEQDNQVMRVTSSQPGASLVLKTSDVSSTQTFTITVGMSKADLYNILSEKAWATRPLADAGKVQQWSYNQGLGIGVLIEGDMVQAITVAPVPPLPPAG